MSKKLEEMTLDELWELFPIVLTPHDPCWAQWYEEEAALLRLLLPEGVGIHHIGSTAVEGIWAKPIVDILIEMPQEFGLSAAKEVLTANGYICMSEGPSRISLNKGYTERGYAERVFHVHLRNPGDTDEVLFRDYLNTHPDAAKEYEQLKLSLWKQYGRDRDGYTQAKGEFIKNCMEH